MDQALTILTKLASVLPEHAAVMRDTQLCDSSRWHRVAMSELLAPAIQEDVLAMLESASAGLTREAIFSLDSADSATGRRRTVIAALMWGYGTNGLRYPTRVPDIVNLLASSDFDERVDRCVAHLAEGDIATAYTDLSNLRGIGASYFTKFLYFLGRPVTTEFPLIMDTLVARSLAALTGFSRLATVSFWPRVDASSYVRYVTTMHKWAQSLDTTAEAIEYFLWHPDPAFYLTCENAYA